MLKHKQIKTRGKLSLSTFFQTFKEGDSVALVRELSIKPNFPKRMQGKTGKVVRKQGQAYLVEVKDINMAKRFVVRPIHLKRIQPAQ